MIPLVNSERTSSCVRYFVSSFILVPHTFDIPVFQPLAGTLPASCYSGIREDVRCYIPSASAR